MVGRRVGTKSLLYFQITAWVQSQELEVSRKGNRHSGSGLGGRLQGSAGCHFHTSCPLVVHALPWTYITFIKIKM